MKIRRDVLMVAGILLAAGGLFAFSRMQAPPTLEGKTAQMTLPPDAVQVLQTPETSPVAQTTSPAPRLAQSAEETAMTDATPGTDLPSRTQELQAETSSPQTASPEASSGEDAGMMGPPMPEKTEKVRGYVVITVGGRQYGDPIPMDRDKIITIRQEDGKTNRVHVTPESVYMESSTCENQDCVSEGEVTPDNYRTRILSTYIICLPHQVQVEMIPAEE